ncbi:hypothetical protein F4X33_21275 [Candidatus Poribacteria bacterium]|nr:hypothetical protein [Candidatus Poribacteria bacterium]
MVYKTYPEEYEIGQKTGVTDEEIEEASNYIKQMREQYGRGSEEHRRAALIKAALVWKQYELKKMNNPELKMERYEAYPEEIEIFRKPEITDEEIAEADAQLRKAREEKGRESDEYRRAARIRSSLFWRRFALRKMQRKSEDEDNTDYEELDRITGVKR